MSPKELQTVKQRYGIVGNCDALNRALETSLKIARVDFSILIQGENGVGKEVLPRIIHDASARKGKKYLALNCGALPEGTIDSELFGHVKGAFTGSVDSREGYFSAADGGTLFLDEVGELPLQTQVRLLRVLETGEFIPVGSSEVKRSNVRIVAATNVDMQRAIAEGRFREDLYYRLAAVSIQMPPLRERGADIDMLFRKFALEISEQYKIPPVRLNDEAKQLLLHYPWPGNVRQLKNVVQNMSITADEREITPEVLELYIPATSSHTLPAVSVVKSPTKIVGEEAHFEQDREIVFQAINVLRHEIEKLKAEVAELRNSRTAQHTTAAAAAPSLLPYHREVPHELVTVAEEVVEHEHHDAVDDDKLLTKDDLERELIRKALIRFNGHRKQAADQIGISERTLYRKIKEYGLDDL